MILPIPLIALVIDQEKRTTRNGSFFWQVVLKTKVGEIKAFMWDAPPDVEVNPKFPHVEDLIEVDSCQNQIEERGNIVIKTYHKIKKEDLLPEDECILEIERASEDELNSALDIIGDNSFWKNKNYHKFTMSILASIEADRLRASPAAVKVHHAYYGGLLVHTAEVLELCKVYVDVAAKRYSFINKDVLFAAAILHDIGKVFTYDCNDLGVAQKLGNERKIGHIFYAMSRVESVARSQKSTEDKARFVDELLHCIAAHHGSREWGSIVETQSLEAGIVSRMDYLSSRNGMMEKVLRENILSEQTPTDEFRIYGDYYFASMGIKDYVANGGLE